jgi:hypothetical protein
VIDTMKSQWICCLSLGALLVILAACQAGGAPTGTTSGNRATDSSGAANPGARTVTLSAQNNSGLTGRATLTDAGGQTMVQLTLAGSDEAHPAHIHNGTCANLDPAPLYPLANVQGGMSSTTVPAPLAELTSGSKAINVHRSPSDMQTYVACGDIR